MESNGLCPQCGRDLHVLKTQRQPAGTRAVQLEWLICDGCHHVALGAWRFLEPVSVGPRDHGDERLEGKDTRGRH